MINCIDERFPDYDDHRRIGNARFNLRPAQICYCSTDEEVADAIKRAQEAKLEIRVRAGGHHHEGMCSGTGVMIIDVSGMADIDVNTPGIARVGPGAKNGRIYDALWYDSQPRRVFAGGGCGDVRVGGFLQGGGWGPYSRLLGMGCDRVAGFRIVLRDGFAREVDETSPRQHMKDLYWSVCGGGGGNFGVVTEFRIKTEVVEGPLSTFTVTWADPQHRQAVVDEWCERFPADPERRLTSFCRITTVERNGADPPVLIGGNCLGGPDEVASILERLLPKTLGTAATVSISPVHSLRAAGFTHPEYQPGPPSIALTSTALTSAAPGAAAGPPAPSLGDTCAGNPFPHMVSSCFPSAKFKDGGTKAIVSYIAGSAEEAGARRYLSLHSMGGAIEDKAANCFAWRDKPFMLQYQAWWADPDDAGLGERCMKWLKTFRDEMRTKGNTEGSFINFPDREINIGEYYRDKFAELKKQKSWFDEDNTFRFEMGIPLE